MSEFSNIAVIGSFLCRPTGYGVDANGSENQIQRLADYDKALGNAGHDRMHDIPASFYEIDMFVLTPANNNTKVSASQAAPWPFTVWAADVACETAAGTTGTVDIMNGGVSILSAPKDVKTAAGVGQRVTPATAEQAEFAFGDLLSINQISGSAADMVGGQAHLYVQRK
jgi:hypothetical protein